MSKNNIEKYLLIDGYNIIFAWEELNNLAKSCLYNARKKLIDMLINYRGYTDENIILVFDAYKVSNGVENIEKYNNINIVYTRQKETADMYIEKVTRNLVKANRVRVATSDNLEQIIILAQGAYVVSAKDLEIEIILSNKNIKEKYIDNKQIKNNMLINNIDKKTAKLLEDIRMKKENS